jgi:hypothetical protein
VCICVRLWFHSGGFLDLRDGIHELRPSLAGVHYRVLYFFHASAQSWFHMASRRRAKLETFYEQALFDTEVASMIYDLRTQADLSQRALARKVGTTASVIR